MEDFASGSKSNPVGNLSVWEHVCLGMRGRKPSMQKAKAEKHNAKVNTNLVDIELVGTWLRTIHFNVVSPTTPKEGTSPKDRTMFCQYVGNRESA